MEDSLNLWASYSCKASCLLWLDSDAFNASLRDPRTEGRWTGASCLSAAMAYCFCSGGEADVEDDCNAEGAKGEEVLRHAMEELPADDEEELNPVSFSLGFLVS